MKTTLRINLRLPGGKIVASLHLTMPMPHRIAVGDWLCIDGGGWDLKVKSVIYNLAFDCWRVSLEDYTADNIEDATSAIIDILDVGWEHYTDTWKQTLKQIETNRPA